MYIFAMLATSPPGGGEVLPRRWRGRFQAELMIGMARALPAVSEGPPSPLRPRGWLPELQIVVVDGHTPQVQSGFVRQIRRIPGIIVTLAVN